MMNYLQQGTLCVCNSSHNYVLYEEETKFKLEDNLRLKKWDSSLNIYFLRSRLHS